MTTIDILQWAGCFLGALGSLMLALNNRTSGYGFVVFLASNVCWMAFGWLTNAPGLVVMQLVFSVTSGLGIWRWLVQPRLTSSASPLLFQARYRRG
jgi:hypothetical protein